MSIVSSRAVIKPSPKAYSRTSGQEANDSNIAPQTPFARGLGLIVICWFSIIMANANEASSSSKSTPKNPNQLRLPPRAEPNAMPIRHTSLNSTSTSFPSDIRSIDGANNNLSQPLWGRADTPMIRLAPADYTNGTDSMAGVDRPGARAISNAVSDTGATKPPRGFPVSDMFWQWGQFLDHDLVLTPEVEPVESASIPVPLGDPWFDPNSTGTQTIHFARSSFSTDQQEVRQQHNVITAYIDASNVYGSDTGRAAALRANDATGRLNVSAGNLLPFNVSGLPNAPDDSPEYFLAGDFRANEQVGLTVMHTLFVREHNRLALELRQQNPAWTGEQIYQQARALVGGLMQFITYNEFLPNLLGQDALPPYMGYRPQLNAAISNEFATAAYRVGHTMLSSRILRLSASGEAATEGHLRLRDAFFRPDQLTEHGIESVLRGLSSQRAQKVDLKLADDVRNMLFGAPGAGGLDLASLNIQRGRDHGLASYVNTRAALGLGQINQFSDITPNYETRAKLESVYQTADEIDLWVGGLAEPAVPRAMVGETLHKILSDQFQRLRDGDRFWYESYLPPTQVEWIEGQTLAKVIRRNTSIGDELSDQVFEVNPNAPMGELLLLLMD